MSDKRDPPKKPDSDRKGQKGGSCPLDCLCCPMKRKCRMEDSEEDYILSNKGQESQPSEASMAGPSTSRRSEEKSQEKGAVSQEEIEVLAVEELSNDDRKEAIRVLQHPSPPSPRRPREPLSRSQGTAQSGESQKVALPDLLQGQLRPELGESGTSRKPRRKSGPVRYEEEQMAPMEHMLHTLDYIDSGDDVESVSQESPPDCPQSSSQQVQRLSSQPTRPPPSEPPLESDPNASCRPKFQHHQGHHRRQGHRQGSLASGSAQAKQHVQKASSQQVSLSGLQVPSSNPWDESSSTSTSEKPRHCICPRPCGFEGCPRTCPYCRAHLGSETQCAVHKAACPHNPKNRID